MAAVHVDTANPSNLEMNISFALTICQQHDMVHFFFADNIFFFTHLFSFRSFQKFCCNMTGPKSNVIRLRYRATSFVLVANLATPGRYVV